MSDVTTWEGMPVPFPAGVDHRLMADRLMRLTAAAPFPAFRWKRGILHAGEAVGCIQVGRLRINILPKLDSDELDRDKLFLLNLLRSAGYLSYLYPESAEVRATLLDPLEVMISEAAVEMAAALREGAPRRYEERREDLHSLRGRIDFTQLSTRPPGQVVVPVRHSPLGVDNRLAQAIKSIALHLHRITRNGVNRQRLGAVLDNLSKVKTMPVEFSHLDTITLSRYETHWSRTLAIGRLLLAGQSPDPTFGGSNEAFSLLFPLPHLYERALRKVLATVISGSDIRVSHRSEPLFLLADCDDQRGVVRLRPDYVFERGGRHVAVADAKWKRVQASASAHGIAREDLYQIHAYLSRYKVKDAMILVPWAPWMSPGWTKVYQDPDSGARVHLVGTDIEGLVSRSATIREMAYAALSDVLGGVLPC
ncbi:hypothetical protein QO209_14695 [Pseudomonas citronellolis]|uniref:McrC family protein n=1 Tax=Pseudomonas citronellolis TaxID=53408 RepID=UPI002649592F|nr:hypothetical protein [Pseudomonas citronellolis]MDN6873690.1 hypothetical protein [Pseudomonas citronellolis]